MCSNNGHISQKAVLNEELWDAYDIKENKLGFKVPRSMAKNLPKGVYHIVVMIYSVTTDGKILTTQRSVNKTYPLKWEVTGGSLLAGEKPVDGAVRELWEETGIKIDKKELRPLYHYIDQGRQSIYYSYYVVIDSSSKVILQKGETMDYKFLEFSDFKKFILSEMFVPSEQMRYIKHKNVINDTINKIVNKHDISVSFKAGKAF